MVDNGCFHSLFSSAARDSYVRTVLRLTRPGSRCLLRCFVRDPQRRLSSPGSTEPAKVERRFGEEFDIEELEPLPPAPGPLPVIDAVYLMTRKTVEP